MMTCLHLLQGQQDTGMSNRDEVEGITLLAEETLCSQYGDISFDLQIGKGAPGGAVSSSLLPYLKSIRNLHIIGDFTVDSDLVLDSAIVKIAADVQITILSNITFTINDSKLFACDGYWKGMFLVDTSASVKVVGEAQIEDAEVGIRVQGINPMYSTNIGPVGIFVASRTSPVYEPMAVEGAHWVVFALTDDGSAHYSIALKGDTVVNGIFYKKVFRYKLESLATIPAELFPPYTFNETSLIGGIRDDIAQRKVYAIAFEDESWDFPDCDKFEEQLLYDFSLAAGDTLNGCLHNVVDLPPIIVDSITSGFFWGKDRNILATGLGTLLEGFGTASGPFASLYDMPVPGNPFQPVDYCIGSDLECGFGFVNTGELMTENRFLVYPNPSTNSRKVNVECPSNMDFPIHLTVLNPLGSVAKVLIIDQIDGNLFTLNLEGFQAGVYTLVMKSQKRATTHFLVLR